MDKEKARKLNWLLWKKQIPFILSLLGITVLIFFIFFSYIYHVENRRHETVIGTVNSWTMPQRKYGTGPMFISVTLIDGTPISARASIHGRAPKKHEKIKLTKSISPFGFTTYHWEREEIKKIPTPEKPKLR